MRKYISQNDGIMNPQNLYSHRKKSMCKDVRTTGHHERRVGIYESSRVMFGFWLNEAVTTGISVLVPVLCWYRNRKRTPTGRLELKNSGFLFLHRAIVDGRVKFYFAMCVHAAMFHFSGKFAGCTGIYARSSGKRK